MPIDPRALTTGEAAAWREAIEGVPCVLARWLVRAAVWLLPAGRLKGELRAFADAWDAAIRAMEAPR